MNELALFAGAGGGILGGKLLGWQTICAVEINDYARSVLLARQDDGCLEPFPVWDDVRTFDGKPWRGRVDIVSGGFPCQDISAAGKGAGIDGERSGMWKHMARIIGEVRPRFALVENSPMLVSRGLGRVLGDLAAMGYDARWGVLGACDASAPHKRDRIWIVAHAQINGWRQGNADGGGLCEGVGAGSQQGPWYGGGAVAHSDHSIRRKINGSMGGGESEIGRKTQSGPIQEGMWHPIYDGPTAGGEDVGNSPCIGWHEEQTADDFQRSRLPSETRRSSGADGGGWWASEPDVGRVAYGVASRVDRLKAIGNGQVPAVVKLAWEILGPGSMKNETKNQLGETP